MGREGMVSLDQEKKDGEAEIKRRNSILSMITDSKAQGSQGTNREERLGD